MARAAIACSYVAPLCPPPLSTCLAPSKAKAPHKAGRYSSARGPSKESASRRGRHVWSGRLYEEGMHHRLTSHLLRHKEKVFSFLEIARA